MSVRVNLGNRSYDIHTGEGLLPRIAQFIPGGIAGRRIFIITDDNVRAAHGDTLNAALVGAGNVHTLSLPPGEGTKSFAKLEHVCAFLLDNKIDRKSLVIAFGGGVIGDLAGFAAAIIMRGVPYVQIPTTLLSQVDSAVGGKTAVNMEQGKNLVGAFNQPVAVVCDTALLRTLPARELRAGYAEIVKYGLLGDAKFFAWLEENGRAVLSLDTDALTHAIETSCRMKAEIVAEDETEQGRRALLNLGHTFAHAFERLCGYDSDILLHGEAVAIGLVYAFALSAKLGHCSAADADKVAAHINGAGLPGAIADIPTLAQCSPDDIWHAMTHDKKADGGRINFILAKKIGDAFVSADVTKDDVLAVIAA